MAGNLTNPDEPLEDSAPVAWALAPQSCAGDPTSPDSCLWYHRVWQYLRLLGIFATAQGAAVQGILLLALIASAVGPMLAAKRAAAQPAE